VPDWTSIVRRRLASVPLDGAREAEIVDELAQHLEDRYRELRARGATDADAERAVRDELEGSAPISQGLRRIEPRPVEPPPAGRARLVATLIGDLRYAVRTLRTHRAFAALAIATLSLGIGATTAIFSVVDAVLLRPLPYREPDRLVGFWLTAPERGLPVISLTEGLFSYYREHSRVFDRVAAYAGGAGFNLGSSSGAERITGAAVSHEIFGMLGQSPLHGRVFLPTEDGRDGASGTASAPRVVVLGYGLWQRRFGGDPKIVGSAIRLDDAPVTVIGIMPPGFDFPQRAEIWVPLRIDPTRYNFYYLDMLGHLRPGRTADDARRDVIRMTDDAAVSRGERRADDPNRSRVVAVPLAEQVAGEIRRPLFVLLGAGVVVLLIACANVANLLLGRAAARTREIALRCCIGASRGRIVVQLLVESLVLSFAGAVGGVALAAWGVAFARRIPVDQVPRIDQVRLDPTVLLFAVGLAVVTGVLFGLAPALRAARVDLQAALVHGQRGSASGGKRRTDDALVVVQFALSLMLLVSAGLLLRSLQHILAVDPGFRADHLLTARVSPPATTYDSARKVRVLYGELLGRVRALPGVRAAAITSRVPLSRGNPQDNIYIEGYVPKPNEPTMVANIRSVSPDYFTAMGTPILRGRAFSSTDADSMPEVVIVDQTLAARYWPNETGIGKRVRFCTAADCTWKTVVGIAAPAKHVRLDGTPDLWAYLPHAQRTTWTGHVVVRTEQSPALLAAALRRELAAIDPMLPLYDVETMEQSVDRSLGTRRLSNRLLIGFAITALALAAVGIYGVMSLAVAGRFREFGVRLALGAEPRGLLRLVIRDGMMLAAAGMVAGSLGAAAAGRVLGKMLFGVGVVDPLTFAVTAALLTAVAFVACYIPARRATRADPAVVLRAE
jgi:putative ABC transport system permease protein